MIRLLTYLSLGTALVAVFACLVSLLTPLNGDSYDLITVRHTSVSIFGRGLYKDDTTLVASGNRGVDYVTLFLACPLLLYVLFCLKSSSLYPIFLLSLQSYFIYVYATFTFASMISVLFLVHISITTLSFFSIFLIFRHFSYEKYFQPAFTSHNKYMMIILSILGFVTTIIWIEAPLAHLISNKPSELVAHYTTLFTHAIDLIVVVPCFFISARLIQQGKSFGYFVAIPVLSLCLSLVPTVTAMTISQIYHGLEFSIAEFVLFIASFVVLGILSGSCLIVILRMTRKLPSPVRLETPRLILRDFQSSDAIELQKGINNLNISKFLTAVPFPYSLQDAHSFISRCSEHITDTPRTQYELAVVDRCDNLIGCVSLLNVDQYQKQATLGYWLNENYWGKGYMTEACRCLLDFGFNDLHLLRINVMVFVDNTASNSLVKKLGGIFEGQRKSAARSRATNSFYDVCIYGVFQQNK
ncbi:hypothetical protein RCL1_003973 [Eukaryota sp. TZLM3-RCL]